MTTRLPSRKIADLFNRTSKVSEARDRSHAQRAAEQLHATELQTRFMRNHFLIDPKSLHLVVDHDKLRRHRCFAVYKPAFCPVRRVDAMDNYHRVSVESYITAALSSVDLQPTVRELAENAARRSQSLRDLAEPMTSSSSSTSPSVVDTGLDVRVLNHLDTYYSGVLLVSLAHEGPHCPRNIHRSVMHYDVLTFGHEDALMKEESIPIEQLFPFLSAEVREAAAADPVRPMRCTMHCEQIGYYAVHAVSLLRISVYYPVTARSPLIPSFLSQFKGKFVVGDLNAFGDGSGGDETRTAASGVSTSPAATAAETKKGPSTAVYATGGRKAVSPRANSLRGDCDFPRLFVHLRSVGIEAETVLAQPSPLQPETQQQQQSSSSSSSGAPIKMVEFHCKQCFEPLIHPDQSMSLKRQRIQIVDGSWSPNAM